MRVQAIELVGSGAEIQDAVDQLEKQCIQTIEWSFERHLTNEVQPDTLVIRVTPHTGDALCAELLELMTSGV